MFRKRSFWIILTAVLLLAGAGYFVYTSQVAVVDAAEDEPAVQTAVVRRGNITISATGAGTIIPATEVALGLSIAGVLTDVTVNVGDKVQTGDVLARIDDTDARQAVINAELQLAQAVMRVNGDATETGVSFGDISVAQALLNLENAQAALDDLLNWQPDDDQIAQAEANLAAAQAGYNAALGQTASASSSITIQQISLDQAQRSLEAAQDAYNTAFDPGREWELYVNEPSCLQGQGGSIPCTGEFYSSRMERERAGAESGLLRAQENLTIAQANYDSVVAGQNNSSVVSAQANLLNAELALAAVQTGPTDDEIAAAQTAVRQAELAYQQALLNQEADQISLQQSELNLQTAEAGLADTTLVSPMDGTILSVAGRVGETAGTSTFITLANLAQPMLEVYMDETDLDKVGVGFEVDVIFDAFPDDTFTGTVVQVDPQLHSVSGVTAVRAVVQLDNFAKPQTLPIGLNATVDIIGGRADNALLVPVEALRELTPGEYALFVMEDGEPKLRMVAVGLVDFTYAEILSGVTEGDVVTTGIVETQ